MPYGNELQWSFLCAMTLALVRVSGVIAFAPFFSSTALPIRTKAVFVGAVAYLLAPSGGGDAGGAELHWIFRAAGGIGGGAGLRADAHAAERDAALCRADRGRTVQLFHGQLCWTRLHRFKRL
jgi:hypothetical protein